MQNMCCLNCQCTQKCFHYCPLTLIAVSSQANQTTGHQKRRPPLPVLRSSAPGYLNDCTQTHAPTPSPLLAARFSLPCLRVCFWFEQKTPTAQGAAWRTGVCMAWRTAACSWSAAPSLRGRSFTGSCRSPTTIASTRYVSRVISQQKCKMQLSDCKTHTSQFGLFHTN